MVTCSGGGKGVSGVCFWVDDERRDDRPPDLTPGSWLEAVGCFANDIGESSAEGVGVSDAELAVVEKGS